MGPWPLTPFTLPSWALPQPRRQGRARRHPGTGPGCHPLADRAPRLPGCAGTCLAPSGAPTGLSARPVCAPRPAGPGTAGGAPRRYRAEQMTARDVCVAATAQHGRADGLGCAGSRWGPSRATGRPGGQRGSLQTAGVVCRWGQAPVGGKFPPALPACITRFNW